MPPDGEPYATLRGSNPLSARVLRFWARLRRLATDAGDADDYDAMLELAAEMEAFAEGRKS